MKCPGQDTRYWKPDDIFEVPCPVCKNPIEFFKNDGLRKCKKCGSLIKNPKIPQDCAQWCPHAKDCIGISPEQKDVGETQPQNEKK